MLSVPKVYQAAMLYSAPSHTALRRTHPGEHSSRSVQADGSEAASTERREGRGETGEDRKEAETTRRRLRRREHEALSLHNSRAHGPSLSTADSATRWWRAAMLGSQCCVTG